MMAYGDYLPCSNCDCKLIYDGDQNIRDALEERYGDLDASIYTVEMLCPKCLKELYAECEEQARLLGMSGSREAKLLAELKAVKKERDESRANDRCAMSYLSEIRQIVGGDDFPDMVTRVTALAKVGAYFATEGKE